MLDFKNELIVKVDFKIHIVSYFDFRHFKALAIFFYALE